MGDSIDKAAKDAAGVLKKIKAAKGKLKGNFYYAGDTRGASAGIVVTLLARDPKGSKASSMGKGVRKEIKGAKFARGTVGMKGSKLLFEVFAGSASPGHMKAGFKKAISELDGLEHLKKALVKKAGSDDVDDTEESDDLETSSEASTSSSTAPTIEDVEDVLDGIDPQELKALMAEQEELGDLNTQLQGFLSDDSTEEELGEQIAEALDELQRLQAEGATDEELEAARRELAELAYAGPDPFPAAGEALSPELIEVLKSSMNAAVQSLGAYLQKTFEALQQFHARLEKMTEEERNDIRDDGGLVTVEEFRRSVLSYRDQLQQNLEAVTG
ncbi:MAG: hypothetical protein AAFV53_11485 [Myxococcota bacterium]